MTLLGDLALVERGEHFKLPQLHLRELGLKHVRPCRSTSPPSRTP